MYLNKTVCFTGHRLSGLGGFNNDDPFNIEVRRVLFETIDDLLDKGVTKFICGMANGVDTWAAKYIALKKQEGHAIKLIAAVPFPGYEYKWPNVVKDKYYKLLDICDEVHYVNKGPYTVWKLQRRNEWMVDLADFVIAVWNGDPSGTANCVAYAKKHSKPVINLWSNIEQ